MMRLYVAHLPEFEPILAVAATREDCAVVRLSDAYSRVDCTGELHLTRRELGMKPAIWFSMLCGGLDGEVREYSWDVVRIGPTNLPA
jgi:hypothetical protein